MKWRLDMSYEYRKKTRTFHRKSCVTQQGSLALDPKNVQRGDIVCISPGRRTPFIFRNGKDGKDRLVGEAYVHGMMDGAMMKEIPEVERIVLY